MTKNASAVLEFAPGTAQDVLAEGQDVLFVGIALTRIGQFAVASKASSIQDFKEWLAAGALFRAVNAWGLSLTLGTVAMFSGGGLLPIPISPIISTCAGTEDEPANCASPCILPMESVKP